MCVCGVLVRVVGGCSVDVCVVCVCVVCGGVWMCGWRVGVWVDVWVACGCVCADRGHEDVHCVRSCTISEVTQS